jgi:glycosyltransferase involved in cell wall biosynthesis
MKSVVYWLGEQCVSDVSLSLLIVANNEEQQIADCIKSGAFANETVVLLDRSSDETGSIAEGLGAKIVKGVWPDEGERRTIGIDGCSGDWVLELDGDERITPELATEISETLPSTSADYFVIPFRNYVGGRYVQFGWGAYNGVGGKAALFRRGNKQWHSGTVHPKITLEGQRAEMTSGINHYVDDDMAGM